MKVKVKVTQSCLTLCDPMDYYTVHGILQARILEWVAISFSRGSSQPWGQIQVPRITGRFFTSWATRKAQENEDACQIQIWRKGWPHLEGPSSLLRVVNMYVCVICTLQDLSFPSHHIWWGPREHSYRKLWNIIATVHFIHLIFALMTSVAASSPIPAPTSFLKPQLSCLLSFIFKEYLLTIWYIPGAQVGSCRSPGRLCVKRKAPLKMKTPPLRWSILN